jgi:hypothetical protein
MNQPEKKIQQDQQRSHQGLLNKILLSFDQVLEFDPKTGDLKRWAW